MNKFLLKMRHNKHRMRFTQIVKFAVIGFIGFGIDSLLLYAFLYMGLGAYTARAVSIPVAMLATWTLNRNWSFGKSGKPWTVELVQYMGVAGFAALVNYGIYALALQFIVGMKPFWALVVASGIAMFVSNFGYGRMVFGKKP